MPERSGNVYPLPTPGYGSDRTILYKCLYKSLYKCYIATIFEWFIGHDIKYSGQLTITHYPLPSIIPSLMDNSLGYKLRKF
ncbi:MAG: hypothetical protein F6K50_24155 [Moorea sp. SIO3I7]|nr:hypothetical protein [Moorena sp. SIO3I7]